MDLISEGTDKISSMKGRELERKLNLQRQQESKKSGMAENEQIDFFQKTFNEKQNYIESLLKKSHTLSKLDLPEHFNVIASEILLLQKYVAASSLFLRNYFLQKCQTTLQELTNQAKEQESELLPKKKFGFQKKIIKPKSVPLVCNRDVVDIGTIKQNEKKKIHAGELEFCNGLNRVYYLTRDELTKKDVTFTNMKNCKIFIEGFPSTLHLENLSQCELFTGPISTSIFAESCQDCTLVIACQQLRLHASKNVTIYLHVTSRAIMEDCDSISIAPYNWTYENIEKDFVNAGLNMRVNNWQCIDDFNWLNAEVPSPHWKVIDKEKRVKDWQGRICL